MYAYTFWLKYNLEYTVFALALVPEDRESAHTGFH